MIILQKYELEGLLRWIYLINIKKV